MLPSLRYRPTSTDMLLVNRGSLSLRDRTQLPLELYSNRIWHYYIQHVSDQVHLATYCPVLQWLY